jgi:predicted GIY-YIG superfamily endonuclease
MYYVYVLKSLVDGGLYIGCTVDLKNRIRSHANGSVESTRKRLPLELIYQNIPEYPPALLGGMNGLPSPLGGEG